MPVLGLSLGLPFGQITVSDSTPVNTDTTTIALTGAGMVGSTVTLTPGTWTNSPTLTYQWRRNGSLIEGETATTYSLTVEDAAQAISCVEIADGTIEVLSNVVTPASLAAPTGLNETTIIAEIPNQTGSNLEMNSTPSVTGGNAPPSFSYQWFLSGNEFSGQTNSFLSGGDTTSTGIYFLRVTATNSEGSITSDSNSIMLIS